MIHSKVGKRSDDLGDNMDMNPLSVTFPDDLTFNKSTDIHSPYSESVLSYYKWYCQLYKGLLSYPSNSVFPVATSQLQGNLVLPIPRVENVLESQTVNSNVHEFSTNAENNCIIFPHPPPLFLMDRGTARKLETKEIRKKIVDGNFRKQFAPKMKLGFHLETKFNDQSHLSILRPFHSLSSGEFSQPQFCLRDLDLLLYGHVRLTDDGDRLALSGLKFENTKFGINEILGIKPADKSLKSRKILNVPEGLELFREECLGVIHSGIVNKRTILARGTKFGPYHGAGEKNCGNQWELFDALNDNNNNNADNVDWFPAQNLLDPDWLSYLNCARHPGEQTMVVRKFKGQIFFEVTKDMGSGEELLVWYEDGGPDHHHRHQQQQHHHHQLLHSLISSSIPSVVQQDVEGQNAFQLMEGKMEDKNVADLMSVNLHWGADDVWSNRVQLLESPENADGYQCDFCGKVFAYKYYRDKHLKYTRCVDRGDRKYPCQLCTRSFEKRDRLRIHVLHVHEKHQPHKCNVCGKSFSQSSSLNKHMRVHSGERPYKCVYCNKAFTASSILRTHIRQHSGEKPFKCRHCGKAFASHAAHDSHVRRTHAQKMIAVNRVPEQNGGNSGDVKTSVLHPLTFQGRSHIHTGTDR